jgi:hypothetical protein
VHAPFWQVRPVSQARPHAPQLALLVERSTQVPAVALQQVLGAGQSTEPHGQVLAQLGVPVEVQHS